MRTLSALAVIAILGWTGAAAADMPPEPGYVERCTLERLQRDGASCAVCDTWYADPDICSGREAMRGLTKCCETRGASVWTEVWCRDACPADTDEEAPQPVAQPTPAPPPDVDPPPAVEPAPAEPTAPARAAPPEDPPARSPAAPARSGGCAVGQLQGRGSLGWVLLVLVAGTALWRRR